MPVEPSADRTTPDLSGAGTAAVTANAGHWLGLQGRVVVVTGAASGIGLGVAQALAQAGAAVAMLDVNAAAVQAAAQPLADAGAQVLALACDIADEAAVQAAAATVRARLGPDFGPVYGLVNNAGLLRPGPLADVALADWNQVLAINLTGGLLCARAFGADMLAAGRGAIVHIASISALNPQTGSGAYSASKAGVLLMSRQLAAEWGPRGVRSNAICPGMVRTALSATFYQQPGFEARRAAVTASRRIGEPVDIAEPTLFLLSPRAGYVNGAELLVDGGLNCMLMDMVPRPGYNQTATDGPSASVPAESPSQAPN